MFDTLARSWEYAKTSYGILWDHKSLVIFPILSALAAGLVTASFLLPLYQTGTLEAWLESSGEGAAQESRAGLYVTAFAFYFCNYFVVIFFNSALVAATMMWMNGEPPTVRGALAVVGKRLPQIFGWALVSAVIGVLLKTIENSNKKVGAIVAAILGSAWTALTYFVVPVIVVDGVGPVKAFKRSVKTLRHTWGTALVGQFSLGLLGLLLMLPAVLVAVLLIYLGVASGSPAAMATLIALAVLLIVTGFAVSSAADTIFKALLFGYATDRSVPAGVDTSDFASAFAPAQEK